MSATRRQMLTQAQRNLELAFLQAENGDHLAAAGNMIAARNLIFGTARQASPAQPTVAGGSNSGSSVACHPHSTGVTQPAAGIRNPGTYMRTRTK